MTSPTNVSLAIRCTRVAQETHQRVLTVLEASTAIGWHPYSEDDLIRFARYCRTFGVRLNMDGEPMWERMMGASTCK